MEDFLRHLANEARGPGGAIAIVQDGKVLGKHVYGYADFDRRIPVTADTIFPICSISKQMTCLVMVDLAKRPTAAMREREGDVYQQMNAELKQWLPHLFEGEGAGLKLEHLYNMQSGIRDYWAMTTLWGAKPDDPFSLLHSVPAALARTRGYHFAPGTEYSYSNVNFHVLGKLLERVAGQSLSQLLAERVFKPAGMKTASLHPYSAGHPLPIVGYEFNEQLGFMPAVNRIEWAGDAGNLASLEDMIAYEQYLHRSWPDESSNYHAIASKPVQFSTGAPASYAFGLARDERAYNGHLALGHGGALRGFRLGRTHFPQSNLSVVVLLNHEGDSFAPIRAAAAKLLSLPSPAAALHEPAPEWPGWYLEDDTGLLVRVEPEAGAKGKINVKYGAHGDVLQLRDARSAASPGGLSATIDGDRLVVERPSEGRTIHARRIGKQGDSRECRAPTQDGFTGVFRAEDADSVFTCTGEGGVLYGAFDGYIGKGPIWLMKYIGEDVWALGNPRGLDATPPGDWTCIFSRGADGKVASVTIGCWLARKVKYQRVE